jgi:glycosyltransferase involved in cell wall biosynthesis
MPKNGLRSRVEIVTASVIISTYNQPEWLELCLRGYAGQDTHAFEIIIADDGSGEATRSRIDQLRAVLPVPVRHVWHPDDGFRKTIILNQAIAATTTDYLIFTDGDCIPRRDFVSQHLRHRQLGRFLSGGYARLNLAASRAIGPLDVESGAFASVEWLQVHGMPRRPTLRKLAMGPVRAWLANRFAGARPAWNGGNASCWRADALRVNGFDERMQYGGEDREFGERLTNLGVLPKQVRYHAVVVHLEHERSYIEGEAMALNKVIRTATKRRRSTWTAHGIVKRPAP